ncbi:putative ATPase YjoB [Symmachiella dynata]|uniref:Putative ATPase YjoB n=1 Tax=Symmachiella dynata TaxID=2527995 RepID=A0A517ZL93_9PLAN|nr:ATP-binding protein [Symmachiella dynata]QDU43195.1 putative ATPase YjoB [Symmachiella dynata]
MNNIFAAGGWFLWGLFVTGYIYQRIFSGKKVRKRWGRDGETLTADLIRRHFRRDEFDDLTISERLFPFRVRADLQRAIDEIFNDSSKVSHFCGIKKEYSHDGITLSACMVGSDHYAATAVPPQYEEVDVGEESPIRCLKTGLWFLETNDQRYVVLLSSAERFGRVTGVQFQIATENCPAGTQIAQQFFRHLEEFVSTAGCYRGKVLSLEQTDHSYSGESSGISVHKLRTVSREQVVLPSHTLDLLDRNVIQFSQRRSQLSKFQQSTKKGILFYGPPGTGKTHTIHYLADALQEHTTLLITAEQIGLLSEYMTLARLLQPSIVVIEDADLIARDREDLNSCEEVILNRLLNEMDGLKEDIDVLFILTTNRPEKLEQALASRPGRIDQAIEFPYPDEVGRAKLVQLYAAAIQLDDELINLVVKRTEGVSAAFIKELMRRALQFQLERPDAECLTSSDVEAALDEMLFIGGKLNQKLLGGDAVTDRAVGFRSDP